MKLKTAFLALFAVAVLPIFVGCAGETASVTTTAGKTSATLDANPGIKQGQTAISDNTVGGTVVNAVDPADPLHITFSLPATNTGTVTCQFKNTASMQLSDDASGLVTFNKNVASFLQANIPKLVAVANSTVAFANLANEIAAEEGWAPANSDQAADFAQVIKQAQIVATSGTALNNLLTTIQSTGTIPSGTN